MGKNGPFSWIMFFVFFHIGLSLFSTVGLFGVYASQGLGIADWGFESIYDILGVTGFGALGTFGLAGLTMFGSLNSGINPLTSLSYGVVMGLYINTWIKTFSLFSKISSDLGAYSYIGYFFVTVFTVIFGYLIINTLANMATNVGD